MQQQPRIVTVSWIAVLLAALGVAGCAAVPAANEDTDELRSALLDARVAWRAVAGESLLAFEPTTTHVRVTRGPDEGDTLSQRLEPADDEQWTLTLEGRQRMHLERDTSGAVVVVREDDFEENVAVHYEPALLLVPAELERETRHEQGSAVTVRHLDTGRVRMRGRVETVLEVVDHGRLTTEGGEHRVYVLRQQRELDLNLARASVRIETAYAPGLGRVAWHVDRRTRTLGVFGSERSDGYELAAEADDGEDAAAAPHRN